MIRKLKRWNVKKSGDEILDLSKSHTSKSDLTEDNDTDEVDDNSDYEILCLQMKRTPHIWRKLDKETGKEHEG